MKYDGTTAKFYDETTPTPNAVLEIGSTASAVNHVKVTNAATGGQPLLSAAGSDTNIPLKLQGKGTGGVNAFDGAGNEIHLFAGATSAVNYVQTTAAATGVAPKLAALGDDTNINLGLEGKGTGGVVIGPGSAPMKKVLFNTATWDPANLAANGDSTSTTITVTGALTTDLAIAGHSAIGSNAVLITAHVSAADTVTVVIENRSGGALDIASGTLSVMVFRG